MNQIIIISIAFGTNVIPVLDCDDGHQRVPLKLITDQFGVNWLTQTERLLPGGYLHTRTGVKEMPLEPGGNPHLCVRLDRIMHCLERLTPKDVFGMSYKKASDLLIAKHEEWYTAIRYYRQATRMIHQAPAHSVGSTDGVAFATE